MDGLECDMPFGVKYRSALNYQIISDCLPFPTLLSILLD